MTEIFRPTLFQPVTVNGIPLAGGKLYFYQAGTTTLITIYLDAGLTTPASNPLTADSSGIFAPIYFDTTVTAYSKYKTVLKTAAGITVQTVDNINLIQLGLGTAAVQDIGTSGAKVPLLSNANTWSATQTIAAADPSLILNKSASGNANAISGYTAGSLRWSVLVGDDTGELGNYGSNYAVRRNTSGGLSTPFFISRGNGQTNAAGLNSNVTNRTTVFTGYMTGNVLTVVSNDPTTAQTLSLGYTLSGGSMPANVRILDQLASTGLGTGTYLTNSSAVVGSALSPATLTGTAPATTLPQTALPLPYPYATYTTANLFKMDQSSASYPGPVFNAAMVSNVPGGFANGPGRFNGNLLLAINKGPDFLTSTATGELENMFLLNFSGPFADGGNIIGGAYKPDSRATFSGSVTSSVVTAGTPTGYLFAPGTYVQSASFNGGTAIIAARLTGTAGGAGTFSLQPIAVTATIDDGSPSHLSGNVLILSAISGATGLGVGWPVTGTGVPASTVIASKISALAYTVSGPGIPLALTSRTMNLTVPNIASETMTTWTTGSITHAELRSYQMDPTIPFDGRTGVKKQVDFLPSYHEGYGLDLAGTGSMANGNMHGAYVEAFNGTLFSAFTATSQTASAGAAFAYALFFALDRDATTVFLKADWATGNFWTKGSISAGSALAIDGSAGLRLPSYTAAQIADKTHAVNTANKGAPKMVWDSTNTRIMIAQGATDVSTWKTDGGATTITPS